VVSEIKTKLFEIQYNSWPKIQAGSIFKRKDTVSNQQYKKKMKFFHKTYTELFDKTNIDVVGSTYKRINDFK